jgi:hypothetical protein
MSDLRGAARLAVDATAGVTEIVEEMHASIARIPTTLGGPIGAVVNGITWLVYRTIHGVTRATGGGLDVALARLPPAVARESSPRRRAGSSATTSPRPRTRSRSRCASGCRVGRSCSSATRSPRRSPPPPERYSSSSTASA